MNETMRYPYQELWPATARKPLLGVAAYSGSGKTTLLKQVIPLLTAAGLRVGLIKHSHHGFDIDYPGKDSYELRKAGAEQVMIASGRRRALIIETPPQTDPALAELLTQLDQERLDLILVEGFKHERLPKLEVHRPSLGRPPLYPDDPNIIAVATDAAELPGVTTLDLNRPEAIAAFIRSHILGER